jgi:hypothetical protein
MDTHPVSHEVMIAPEAPDRTSVMEDAGYEFPRIPPSKLFGKSEWVPNRGYESGQDGSRSPDRPTLGAKDLRSRRLQLFTKHFLQALR